MDDIKVYAIVSGELYEGHSVRGVFSTEEAACKAAAALVARENADDCSYKQADDVARWVDGSYYIELVEWPLDKLFA